MDIAVRKNIRLKEYDYRTYGGYFVTICTENRKALFWSEQEKLSQIGEIVDESIRKIPMYYPTVILEKYVVMPNHVHILLIIENQSTKDAPSLSRIVKQLKSSVTKQAGYPVWQKSFYDRVIRNQQEYSEIWQYIDNNPVALSVRRNEQNLSMQ